MLNFLELIAKRGKVDESAKIIYMLACVAFLVMLGIGIISPVLPIYAKKLSADTALASYLVSSFGIARVFMDLPSGVIIDAVGERRLVQSGLGIIIISSILCGLANSYSILLLGRILEGVGSAMYTITALTLIAKIAPKKSRGKHMSIYTGMLLFGSIFGPAIGGFTSAKWGMNSPFFVYAFVVLIGSFIAFYVLRDIENVISRASNHSGFDGETRKSAKEIFSDIKSVTTDKSFIIVTLATFMLFYTRTGINSTMVPLFAVENLHLTEDTLGGILALAAFFTFITMTTSGNLTDKYGRKPLMMCCMLLTAVMTIIIPYSRNVLDFTAIMVAYGFTLGLSGPMAAWATDLIPKDKLGAGLGFFRTVVDFGFILGPSSLGFIVQQTSGGAINELPFFIVAFLLFIFGSMQYFARDVVGEERKNRKIELFGG